MSSPVKILTINGSPHDDKSNTRALVEDFVADLAGEGLPAEHRIISLGRMKVLPCRGCWNCTRGKACPLAAKDDVEAIKAALVECDLLILASPVYCNHVTAQMKALIDRLFTWCHIFPLLGKYSLSACTTGGDGIEMTGDYLEKMLATYGTYSFGTLSSRGGLTSGFFPAREMARARNRKLVRKVARTILAGKRPRVSANQRRMFGVMKRKMMGIHTINYLRSGDTDGQPKPPWLLKRMIQGFIRKGEVTESQLASWASLLTFELGWWKKRGWLHARSFGDLASRPVPGDFDARRRLLGGEG